MVRWKETWLVNAIITLSTFEFFFEIEANPAFLLTLHTQNMTTWFYFRDVFYYVFVVPSCWVHKDAITINSRDETLKSQMRLRNPIFISMKNLKIFGNVTRHFTHFFLWFQDEPFREWQDSREFDEKKFDFHTSDSFSVWETRESKKKMSKMRVKSTDSKYITLSLIRHSSRPVIAQSELFFSHPTNPFFHIALTHSKRINADEHKNETIQHQYSASPPSLAASHTTHICRTVCISLKEEWMWCVMDKKRLWSSIAAHGNVIRLKFIQMIQSHVKL